MPVSQNSDLSSKLNPTHQHDFKGMFGFQNKIMDIKLLKFHANRDNMTYIENIIFNGSLFVKYDTAIGFVVLKRVQEWSWILILESRLALYVK